jgi:2-oxoglutarate ferredoxin oxidoreductase subunit delta
MAHIEIEMQLCKGCELCTLQCAKRLLYLSDEYNAKGYKTVKQKDAQNCTGCRLCAYMCPEAAITVYKEAR